MNTPTKWNSGMEKPNISRIVNTMLISFGLRYSYLGEALVIICYILNRIAHKDTKITPYELNLEET